MGLGNILFAIVKFLAKVMLGMVMIVLNAVKVFLLLFGLVARVFLVLVRVGTV